MGDVHSRALGDTYDGHVRRDRICLLHVEDTSRAGCGLGLLAMRVRKMGPRIDDIRHRSLGDTHDGHVRRDRICQLHV